MRLFLTSHDFGSHKNALLKLMGAGRKALIITNARDYYENNKRLSDISEKMEVMKQAGIEVEEIDLKKYFGKKDELAEYIKLYNPDLIFAIGGNIFLLATAYQLSGFDDIVTRDLKQDKYVYGGNSAGAMVTTKHLKNYSYGHLVPEAVVDIYGVDAVLDGLGLIDKYIIAHADVPKHQEATKVCRERIENDGGEVVLLNQSSAMVVDGIETTILP